MWFKLCKSSQFILAVHSAAPQDADRAAFFTNVPLSNDRDTAPGF